VDPPDANIEKDVVTPDTGWTEESTERRSFHLHHRYPDNTLPAILSLAFSPMAPSPTEQHRWL
jgi:hypothetical protein